MLENCPCSGTLALLSEGADGFVKSQSCICVQSLEPIPPAQDEFSENWVDSTTDQAILEFANSWKAFQIARKKHEVFSEARIPNLYVGALNANFYQKEILEWNDQFLSGEVNDKLLFFFGGVGTGKTQTAIFLMMKYLQSTSGHSGLYLRTYNLLEKRRCANAYSYEAKALKDNAEQAFQTTLKKVLAADFLVLDELGQEKLSSPEAKVIFDLIDSRHTANKVTIFISNHCDNKAQSLDGLMLSKLVGARISSRLSAATSFYFSGPDYRVLKQSEKMSKEEIEGFMVPAKILTHSDDEHQIMTWLTRNPAFEVVSTQKRRELTEVVDGEERDKDRPQAAYYKDVWVEGDKLIIQGPICDHEDKKLYALLIKELANSHKEGNKGLTLKISLKELVRLSQLSECGDATNKLKRQLNRLVRMSFDFRNAKGNRWMGPLLNDVEMVGNSNDCRMVIEFNRFMITFYRLHAYTTFDRSISQSLKGDSSAFYLFYSSHSMKEMTISVDRCKKLLAIDENLDKDNALKRVRKAIENLITSGVMDPEKTFVKNGKVYTCRA